MKYKNETLSYDTNQQVQSDCNMITFINKGTCPVRVDSYTLLQDEKVEYSGFPGETDTTKYNIVFANTGVLTQKLYAIRKVYVS